MTNTEYKREEKTTPGNSVLYTRIYNIFSIVWGTTSLVQVEQVFISLKYNCDCPFVLFHSVTIVLSILFRLTASDDPFGIFNFFSSIHKDLLKESIRNSPSDVT